MNTVVWEVKQKNKKIVVFQISTTGTEQKFAVTVNMESLPGSGIMCNRVSDRDDLLSSQIIHQLFGVDFYKYLWELSGKYRSETADLKGKVHEFKEGQNSFSSTTFPVFSL